VATAPGISGHAIAPLLPIRGPVSVLIVGEAPGPRGADKSGIPFFGDAAGRHLYRALRNIDAVELAVRVDDVAWDGATLMAAGFAPVAHSVSLTNAFNRCPTDDGVKFRAPHRVELESPANTERLLRELRSLEARGLRGVVTLGKVAERTMTRVIAMGSMRDVTLHALPHPSAQGLLSMAPHRGRGARMADLQDQWIAQCERAVRDASGGGIA
jgi:hypothetical protein